MEDDIVGKMINDNVLNFITEMIYDSKYGKSIEKVFLNSSNHIDVIVNLDNHDEQRELGKILDEISQNFGRDGYIVKFHQYKTNQYEFAHQR